MLSKWITKLMSSYFWLKFVLYFQYVCHVYFSFSQLIHSPIFDTDHKGESDLKPNKRAVGYYYTDITNLC